MEMNNIPPNINNIPPINMAPNFQYNNMPPMTNMPPIQSQFGYRQYNQIPTFSKRHQSLPFLHQPMNTVRRRPPPIHPQTNVGLPPNVNIRNNIDSDYKSPRYLSTKRSSMNSQNTDTSSKSNHSSSQRQILERVKSKDSVESNNSKKSGRNTKFSRRISKPRKEKQIPDNVKIFIF